MKVFRLLELRSAVVTRDLSKRGSQTVFMSAPINSLYPERFRRDSVVFGKKVGSNSVGAYRETSASLTLLYEPSRYAIRPSESDPDPSILNENFLRSRIITPQVFDAALEAAATL